MAEHLVLTDAVREDMLAAGNAVNVESLSRYYPSPTGDPAFEPDLLRQEIAKIQTFPRVQTGSESLDKAILTGLACIDLTFDGLHPHYGVKHYGEERHDGFPPTIIAAVDALTLWDCGPRAAELFQYWVMHFIGADGRINYYGPALSEYGQLLHTAMLLYEGAGAEGWWANAFVKLRVLADYLLAMVAAAAEANDLLSGVPEADISQADPHNLSDPTHNESHRYFHNNAWVARGLQSWAYLLHASGNGVQHEVERVREMAAGLAQRTVRTMEDCHRGAGSGWWVPPQVEPAPVPEHLTASTYASYTNYRYFPELLSSGVLPPEIAHALVEARLQHGGQYCGATRFEDRLDDWPLADYLHGLWRLGRHDDFRLSLIGHVVCHQAGDHLTAYEQVTLPPGREVAPYCLPCQLVATRAGRYLQL